MLDLVGKNQIPYFLFTAQMICGIISYDLHHETTGLAYAKTNTQINCAVTVQLISAFVFATQIVQSLLYLNPKFQASSLLL